MNLLNYIVSSKIHCAPAAPRCDWNMKHVVRNCILALADEEGSVIGFSGHLMLLKFRQVGGIDPGIFKFHHDCGVEAKTERQVSGILFHIRSKKIEP